MRKEVYILVNGSVAYRFADDPIKEGYRMSVKKSVNGKTVNAKYLDIEVARKMFAALLKHGFKGYYKF